MISRIGFFNARYVQPEAWTYLVLGKEIDSADWRPTFQAATIAAKLDSTSAPQRVLHRCPEGNITVIHDVQETKALLNCDGHSALLTQEPAPLKQFGYSNTCK